jgi:hypothetical protein
MGEETSDIDRIMEAELSARSARERKQCSTGPAAVGAAPSGDAANLEFVARRHEELLRLREEGEEDNGISEADLVVHAARGRILPCLAGVATVCAASACGPSPCPEEIRGTVNVSDKCFCFFYPSTLNSKLIIHFL